MKKIYAILASLLLCAASMTAQQITVAVDGSSTYKPTQIKNGSFSDEPWMTFTYNNVTYSSCPNNKNFDSGGNTYASSVVFNGVDKGWNTTELSWWRGTLFEYSDGSATHDCHHNGTIPMSDKYVEMNCYHATMLYQDLTTHGRDVIRWTLKHAVTPGGDEVQPMHVEIGAPNRDGNGNIVNASGWADNLNPQIVSSTKAIFRYNGVKDNSGNTSTRGFGSATELQYLRLTKTDHSSGWWTAQGVYIIPDGQTVTRFGFVSEAAKPNSGNLLDDITFSTLVGNLSAHQIEGGAVELKGYWGETTASKTLKVVVGSTTHSINMTSVTGKNFVVTIPAATIGSATNVTVYHEDYYAARLTLYIAPAYTVELASGTENASDWSFSPASAKEGLTVAINNNGTRTIENVTVSRNISSTVEIRSSDYSTKINDFNGTDRSKLKFMENVTNTLTVTRDEAEIDLNGFTAGTIMTPNNKYGYALTIKNGALSGVDGAGGWDDWFSGTLIFENVTMNNTLWSDGHEVIIKCGTYSVVNNYKKGDTPGTVTIYDGKFMTFNNADPSGAGASHGTYILYGGKYHFNPTTSTSYTTIIPAGYALQSNTDSDNGTYPWKVVNTDPTKAVEFDELHLTQVTKDHEWTFTMPRYDVKVEVQYTDFQGHGTEEDPYLIPSTEVWNQLAANVTGGKAYAGKYFRQTADISVTTMVGTSTWDGVPSRPFSGTYDGDGHKLTVTISSSTATAPFRSTIGATIKNLHIAGTITASSRYAGSIVGYAYGANTISNCRSSVEINATTYGDGSHGGLVGRVYGADRAISAPEDNVIIEGCIFDGKLSGSNTNNCSGFVGWCSNDRNLKMYLSNSVFAPTKTTMNTDGCMTFSRGSNLNEVSITNCYYTKTFGGEQAKQMYSITAGEGVTVASAAAATEYNVSGITSYGTGIKYNNVLYGGNGDAVSMTLSGAPNYSATTGTLAGTANPYTLTMANANSEINFVPVAKVTTSGNETTYYPTFDDAVNHWVNNSTLTLLANVERGSTINISNTRTLDLNGFGIKRTGYGRVFYIGGSGNLTINDSNPDAVHKYTLSNEYNGAGLATLDEASGSLTVNGGYITGGNTNEQGGAIYVDGQLTINGGNIIGNHSDAHGGAIKAQESYATITMNGGRICYNTVQWQGALTIGDATLRLYGGEISHNRSLANQRWHNGGVDICGGTFYLHGAPLIYGNYGGNEGNTNQPNDICLEQKVTIDGEMTNTTPIGIMMNLGGYDGKTRGQFSFESAYVTNETASHFTPQNYPGDEVVRIGNALWIWNSIRDTHGTVAYQVTYDSRGGSAVTGQTVLSGEKASQPENPTKAGVTFTGWYKDVLFSEAWNFATDVVNADMTLYARYSNDAALIDAPTANAGLIYAGVAQALVSAGAADGGTMMYSTDNSTWSDAIPTKTIPGNYTVYYMVAGDATHADLIPAQNEIAVSIVPAQLTIEADNKQVVYGEAVPSYTATITGFVNGEDKTVLTGTLDLACLYAVGSGLGNYDITPSGYSSDNYTISYQTGTLTVSTPNQIVMADDADYTATLAALNGQTLDVQINRSFVTGIYNTCCLPFSMSAAEIAASPLAGATLKNYDGADVTGEGAERDLNLYLSELTEIEAGKPFLLKPETDLPNPLIFTGVQISYTDQMVNPNGTVGELIVADHVDFQGIMRPFLLSAYSSSSPDYLGVGQDGRLYWADGSKSTGPMRAFRGFFHVKDAGSSNNAPVRRGMHAQFVENSPQTPTGVESIQPSAVSIQKIIRDGVLYIIRDGKMYTAQGVEVE
ncbi:MAG: InlB B-repeat-containing protein [Paludibacteraceae bacterium]|nr:InlB B-repeat-containing protein [Paludibacteraceae bacterium]